ncbi:hypothetical protein KM043_010049 [Ampulex compressa]|nr:hypothetical protein KM043_010049 [Ampulex compressa]
MVSGLLEERGILRAEEIRDLSSFRVSRKETSVGGSGRRKKEGEEELPDMISEDKAEAQSGADKSEETPWERKEPWTRRKSPDSGDGRCNTKKLATSLDGKREEETKRTVEAPGGLG